MIYRGPNMNPCVVSGCSIRAGGGNPLPGGGQRPGHADRREYDPNQPGRRGHGLVSIPNRYMHSPVEMISLAIIDHAADLLAGLRSPSDGPEKVHALSRPRS